MQQQQQQMQLQVSQQKRSMGMSWVHLGWEGPLTRRPLAAAGEGLEEEVVAEEAAAEAGEKAEEAGGRTFRRL